MAKRRKTDQQRNDYLLPAYREALQAITAIAAKHECCLICLSKAVACGVLNNLNGAGEFTHGRGEEVHNDLVRAMVAALSVEAGAQANAASNLANMPVAGHG